MGSLELKTVVLVSVCNASKGTDEHLPTSFAACGEPGHAHLDLPCSMLCRSCEPSLCLSSSDTRCHFAAENSIVVAEGQLQLNGTFQVAALGLPPVESREDSLKAAKVGAPPPTATNAQHTHCNTQCDQHTLSDADPHGMPTAGIWHAAVWSGWFWEG